MRCAIPASHPRTSQHQSQRHSQPVGRALLPARAGRTLAPEGARFHHLLTVAPARSALGHPLWGCAGVPPACPCCRTDWRWTRQPKTSSPPRSGGESFPGHCVPAAKGVPKRGAHWGDGLRPPLDNRAVGGAIPAGAGICRRLPPVPLHAAWGLRYGGGCGETARKSARLYLAPCSILRMIPVGYPA